MVILAVGQFSSCKKGAAAQKDVTVQEDSVAKQMLQGIWVDEDEQDVAFKAQGDSIFYPDSTSMPVRFQIIADTLVLHGASDVKYPILKQTRHLFVFRNQNGDEIRLVLSDDADDANFFSDKHPQPLNQGKLIKRDTIVSFQNKSYHCYIQINPTTYKVIKSSWNDEGVEVEFVIIYLLRNAQLMVLVEQSKELRALGVHRERDYSLTTTSGLTRASTWLLRSW